MRAKVQKWGDSIVIRTPKPLASEVQLNNNSLLEIRKIKNEIVSKSEWILNELLSGITDNNIHHEVDSGFVEGNEIW